MIQTDIALLATILQTAGLRYPTVFFVFRFHTQSLFLIDIQKLLQHDDAQFIKTLPELFA